MLWKERIFIHISSWLSPGSTTLFDDDTPLVGYLKISVFADKSSLTLRNRKTKKRCSESSCLFLNTVRSLFLCPSSNERALIE